MLSGTPLTDFLRSDLARDMLTKFRAPVVVIDETGAIKGFGKAAEELFGHSEPEVIGRDVSMLMGAPHADRHAGYLRHYLETGESRIIGVPRIANARHRDGHLFPVQITITEMKEQGRRYFIGLLQPVNTPHGDAQEIYRLLEELSHASRISAMGAMATALAHELNQPLTSIANYTEGLRDMLARRDDVEGRDEFVRILDECAQQAIRAGKLIHRLREFVKGSSVHIRPVEVERLVDESLRLALINGFKRTVHVETDIPAGLPSVIIDPLQGQQVLFNLIRNALEAMEDQEASEHRLRIAARPVSGGMVEISVEDTGPGISTAMRDAIFGSFVTSKADGMGVGLAICRQIVEAHGGSIWVEESIDLGGAAFRFALPTHDGNAPDGA